MAITVETLPNKFYPYLLGHPKCSVSGSDKLHGEVARPFREPHTELTRNVFRAGDYIFKSKNMDRVTTSDTHLYRIRKAEKIQKFIKANSLHDCVTVPEKYLYGDPTNREIYTVSRVQQLSTEVAQPTDSFGEILRIGGESLPGQVKAFREGAPQRELTPKQAQTLARLAFATGYTDLTYNNTYFTADNKIAIIDTEPQKRSFVKSNMKTIFFKVFGDRGSMHTQQAIAGAAKLKLICSNPLALKEVEKVEKKEALWGIAKLVAKIGLAILVISFIPYGVALLPIAGMLATSVEVALIALAAIKTVVLILNCASIGAMWFLSCKEGGVTTIHTMEQAGMI